MSEQILTQIKSQYPYFTKVEKKIADIILKDPQKFITYSTATVAKLADVSQGSINNFSRKFCEEGFSFLKLEIARCVSNHDKYLEEVPSAATKKGLLFSMERKIRQNISALCHTLEINSEQSLQKAVEIILAADKTETFGVCQSGIVAKTFSFRLTQIGIPSAFSGDALMVSASLSFLTENDAFIAISASGESANVIDAVKISREKGCKIICITANKFSTLAKLSDVIILTSEGSGKRDGLTDRMRNSQFLITDTICNYIDWLNSKK